MSLDGKRWIIVIGLAALGATNSNAASECPDYLQFLKSRCQQWQSYVLPKNIPDAHGNAFADNDAAAALGMKIFYDNRFSQSGSGVACVNCHDPEHAFAERKPTSHTIREVARNAPDLIDAAWYTKAHFWDGKVDNLWSAPLFTFEQEDEMGSTRLSVVHTLASIYKIRYEKVFGPMPDLSDAERFPSLGKPGTAQFDAMSESDKYLVNQIYANVGKALEAYIRKLAAGRAPFDDFMMGSAKSLNLEAQRGMVAFSSHRCDTCHFGPTFTDEEFHDLGYARKDGQLRDLGRAVGLKFATQWQFTAASVYFDRNYDVSTTAREMVAGDPNGFRTPSLRNVEATYPYGHNGAFATLEAVIDAHSGVLPDHQPIDEQDKHDIIAFLHSLSGRPPLRPWNYWPGG